MDLFQGQVGIKEAKSKTDRRKTNRRMDCQGPRDRSGRPWGTWRTSVGDSEGLRDNCGGLGEMRYSCGGLTERGTGVRNCEGPRKGRIDFLRPRNRCEVQRNRYMRKKKLYKTHVQFPRWSHDCVFGKSGIGYWTTKHREKRLVIWKTWKTISYKCKCICNASSGIFVKTVVNTSYIVLEDQNGFKIVVLLEVVSLACFFVTV